MHGNAKKTSGGLTKSQLKYNKQGKIVSRKASALAKKNNRLVKAGYKTQKGVFGNGEMRGGDGNGTNIIFSKDGIATEHTMSYRDFLKMIILKNNSDINGTLKLIIDDTLIDDTLKINKLKYNIKDNKLNEFQKYCREIYDILIQGNHPLSQIHITNYNT
tara:strand:+ start:120 stop:599 length:480 start_codon:yes stop_codon:yes gene_type:complete